MKKKSTKQSKPSLKVKDIQPRKNASGGKATVNKHEYLEIKLKDVLISGY